MTDFDYSNLSGRPVGPFVSLAARLLPGVRQVQDQVEPYAAAWQRDNRLAVAGSGPLWVVLGDSLSQGIGASGHDRGWVGQLAEQLIAQGRISRVLNLAVSGARVSDVLDRQLPALQALPTPPALVTLLIGSNDLFRRRYRLELPAGFEVLLQRLPAGTVVANLPNPNATADALNRSLQRAVTDRGLVLADLRQRETTSWRGKLAADHFHPNDLGYAGIARVFADAIEPLAELR
ncbi:MAG: SGNH/GDSL hydrolase family protein [Actinomycetota bacterium]|nr:SGNH/GDSL hydrolase family protein [Actinomycetota bacterium]MDQ2957795.1 SGNH/GDSL hydrolase family protein [Actinomycetota bacterium]